MSRFICKLCNDSSTLPQNPSRSPQSAWAGVGLMAIGCEVRRLLFAVCLARSVLDFKNNLFPRSVVVACSVPHEVSEQQCSSTYRPPRCVTMDRTRGVTRCLDVSAGAWCPFGIPVKILLRSWSYANCAPSPVFIGECKAMGNLYSDAGTVLTTPNYFSSLRAEGKKAKKVSSVQ